MLLEVRDLSVSYGMMEALKCVSFDVGRQEIVAMVGSNGAGKSTALKAVVGTLEASGGRIVGGKIWFEQKSIKGLQTHELVRKGIALVPEGRRVFPTLTVVENLEMGAYTRSNRKSTLEDIEEVLVLFPIFKNKIKQKAGTLSTGEQQMLALGRALMARPELLLADEPSLGLSPNHVDLIFEKLVEINKQGTSILIVEQNAVMALEIANRGYLFSLGEITLSDTGKNILESEQVNNAFLGNERRSYGTST